MTEADNTPTAADTFPRQYARTRRFSLGEPRGFRISADETRIVFLRTSGGSDPVQKLWALETDSSGNWKERLLVDPLTILGQDDHDLPAEEKARRERLREQANGITAFDANSEATLAVFAMSGVLYLVDVTTAEVRTLTTDPGAYDPRIAPDGSSIAYVANRGLHVASTVQGAPPQLLIGEDDENVSWGVADFIAAEELDRYRGFWWSPDSKLVLVARVDETPVNTWWIADPSNPAAAPRSHRYPAAGTANALVSLAIIDVATRSRVDVEWCHNIDDWSHAAWPYLVHAAWTDHGCTAVLMDRAQTSQRVVDIEPASGRMRTLHSTTDSVWVELCPGTPSRLAGDYLVLTASGHITDQTSGGFSITSKPDRADQTPDREQTQALVIREPGGAIRVLTPANMQVRRVAHVSAERAVVAVTVSRALVPSFAGLEIEPDTGAISLVSVALDGSGISLLAGGADVGTHDASVTGVNVSVIRSASVNRTRADIRVLKGSETQTLVRNFAEVALVNPKPIFFTAGPRAIPCVLFLPSSNHAGSLAKLPVLMDPYGGPHAQRVVQSRNAHATSQWFADQGFAVVVVDGRGTPGPGPLYEKACHNDFTDGVVDDQVTGLVEATRLHPQLDLARVAIRGWSFGGFLAAMAVLERPDVFHAAVVGAPVTDWRLYDTGYTERYLGHPATNSSAYDNNSVLTRAHKATRPMMLIHGLADDNVVCAHTLQLSGALLAHGKPHEVLPLSNVTHMTPQEEVAENLLKLQVDFLRRSLRL